MVIGAIVVLGESSSVDPYFMGSHRAGSVSERLAVTPIASLEILGMSALQRTVQHLQRTGVDTISFVTEKNMFHVAASMAQPPKMIPVRHSTEVRTAIQHVFGEYLKNGIETVLLVRLGAYIEFDLADLIRFHQDKGQPVTRISDREGPLDFWVLDATACSKVGIDFGEVTAAQSIVPVAHYNRPSYVNRLSDAFCLRRFVVDSFLLRCSARPSGEETKPGVWIDQSAQVDRRARIVAPAYIGPRAKIRASALITRFSNVERGCEVDCGTAVDNSSILAHTYLGTWLDVQHAVVYGSKLAHLHHNLTIEIKDPRLISKTASALQHRAVTGMQSL